jgi:hypothetical protein
MKSFKIIISLLLVTLCVILCVACDNKTNAPAADNDGGGKKTDNVESKSGFYVEYKGVKITMGAKADNIIEALGEPQSRSEIGDCGGLGAQVRYTYPSVEVYVLESKTDGNIIDEITFRDDTVSTPEGVSIGMSVSDAKKALGEPSSETDDAILYTSGKYVLKVTVENEVVSKISYKTVSE